MSKSSVPLHLRTTVSVNEAAGLIGICKPAIYHYIHSGELPSFRLGRRRLIRRESLEEFQRKREEKHTAALRGES